MPRQYGYMENGVFTPVSQSSGSNAQNGIGQFTNEQWALLQDILNERMGNYNRVAAQPRQYLGQNNYGVPYSNAPAYGQRFYGPGYAPTNVAVGFANGPRVRYNYQPRYTGNGYAPRGYNTNMNYGPWYGQQSYATRAPYAPNQPYYETVIGSNGQPVTMRLGEYQREQPVGYETMFNSQGVPVQVPVYAPMNNSAMPVRVGVSPDGQPYGNVNYQTAFPQQTTQQTQRTTTSRVRNMPEPVANQALYRTADWNDTMTNDWQRTTAAERANPDNNRVLALPEDINYQRLLNDDPTKYNLEKVNQYLLKNYSTVDKLEELLNNGTLPSNILSTLLLPQYSVDIDAE